MVVASITEKKKLEETQNDFQVFIVSRQNPIYWQGRKIAQLMYQQVWATEHLVDNNDYAAVVFWQGSIIANVNVQLRKENGYLKSELFFQKEHWQSYFNLDGYNLAEISGLAISDKIPSSLSRSALMMLILGLRILQYSLNIRFYTTVQHEFLIRILNQSLNLPFQVNEIITQPSKGIPQDKYWQRDKLPRIYYLDGHHEQSVKACDSYFYYLNLMGIKLGFSTLVPEKKLHYSRFWKFWDSAQMYQLQVA